MRTLDIVYLRVWVVQLGQDEARMNSPLNTVRFAAFIGSIDILKSLVKISLCKFIVQIYQLRFDIHVWPLRQVLLAYPPLW